MRFDRLFTYDLLEDGRIDDITNNNIFLLYFMEHIDILVTVRLFGNRSQKASKCAKNVSGTLAGASCETFRTYYIWQRLWSFTERRMMNSVCSAHWLIKHFFSRFGNESRTVAFLLEKTTENLNTRKDLRKVKTKLFVEVVLFQQLHRQSYQFVTA